MAEMKGAQTAGCWVALTAAEMAAMSDCLKVACLAATLVAWTAEMMAEVRVASMVAEKADPWVN